MGHPLTLVNNDHGAGGAAYEELERLEGGQFLGKWWRERRRVWSESLGDMKAPVKGWRFGGGNACGDIFMN
ncbi:hypothetical protein DVH24_016579 [Malus domestica]|uniref:Uncharacterized protein n=1 Tax=Malus domestica TaxID=3750 RepID=A0A498HW46_MALDO|nr:hypothetical protein DVH24_016579 [Malus domestica]